jgi:hypothetical protein
MPSFECGIFTPGDASSPKPPPASQQRSHIIFTSTLPPTNSPASAACCNSLAIQSAYDCSFLQSFHLEARTLTTGSISLPLPTELLRTHPVFFLRACARLSSRKSTRTCLGKVRRSISLRRTHRTPLKTNLYRPAYVDTRYALLSSPKHFSNQTRPPSL